jgi:hypothetical protein
METTQEPPRGSITNGNLGFPHDFVDQLVSDVWRVLRARSVKPSQQSVHFDS